MHVRKTRIFYPDYRTFQKKMLHRDPGTVKEYGLKKVRRILPARGLRVTPRLK
jgi:hypothetical protein